MKIFIEPNNNHWELISKRAELDYSQITSQVKSILDDVKSKGDEALLQYITMYDKFPINNIEKIIVSEEEIVESKKKINKSLREAIDLAYNNIYKFHKHQITSPKKIETVKGVKCWRRDVPIEKVGLYIPGGTAPLFSTVLMLGVPAQIAGCKEKILCTPPTMEGNIAPPILYAASLVEINRIYKVGGAHAIAAMAYGTKTIPEVYKIFGPGNQYVTIAKQLVMQQGTAIDLPAGPSELLVWADESCKPEFVAADLLSQAEHGNDSQVILVVNSLELADKVQFHLKKQLEHLPRKSIVNESLKNSSILVFHDKQKALDFINYYAPEHLIISCENALKWSELIVNAGSVFIGNFSPESAGDYASGTNHTLPTNGYARVYSGVSLESFVKKITFQQISPKGLLSLGDGIMQMAEAENLYAHKYAVSIRVEKIKKKK
jgi:histidinol dehydrogenase